MEGLNIYAYALKNKLRFPYKEHISTEDLFDLSLNSLNLVYKNLIDQEFKSKSKYSLLDTHIKEDEELAIKISIVKDIFTMKRNEIDAKNRADAIRASHQKIV